MKPLIEAGLVEVTEEEVETIEFHKLLAGLCTL